MSPADALPAVTPEEEEAFCSLALRTSISPENAFEPSMLDALMDFRMAGQRLVALGWKRHILTAVDGTEALVLVHQAAGPIKATFCGDWDGSWFAELVDGELTPIQPILFFPLRRVPR